MARALSILSVVAAATVVVGFGMFALGEAGDASRRQQESITGKPTGKSQPPAIQRRFEEAYDALVSPFTGVARSDDIWVEHGVPAVLAFLVWGLGLGYVSRLISVR